MSGVALNRWALSEKDDDEDMFNMFAIGGYCLCAAFRYLQF